MKNLKQLAFLLCAVLILFGSCTKSVPPHLKAVPGNAVFVLAIENRQLISKSGLKDGNFIQKMRDRAGFDEGVRKMIDKFIENPKSTGLDLDQSYLFGLRQDEGFFMAMVFRMDHVAAFEANIKELIQKNGGNEPEDRGAYKIMEVDGLVAAWNGELFIAGGGRDCEAIDYGEFFNMPQEKSIVSVADFNDFNSRGYDIGLWASYGAIADLAASAGKMDKIGILKELSDTYVHSYLDFENGEAKFSSLMTPQSKMKDFFAKYPIFKKDFDNNLLAAFPDKSYLAFKLSIDVMEYIKMLREVAKQMDTDLPIDRMMLNNPVANTIINGLGGDMLLDVYGFAQGPLPVPLAGIAFTVKSRADFDKMLALVPQEMVTKTGEYYVMATGAMVSMYFAYKDNVVYVTDDADAVAAFTGKGFDKRLSASTLGKGLEKSPSLFYINLDVDSYPGNVRSLLQSEMGSQAGETLKYLKPYKDFSIMADNTGSGVVLSLKFKDASQNALKQILKNLDETQN